MFTFAPVNENKLLKITIFSNPIIGGLIIE
jgi:hypothetical protein